jgi:ABC-type transport system involved in multi-copper enzyme maturation permease subunit
MLKNILQTEWLKVKNYTAFWLLISVAAISYPGINAIVYFTYDDITKGKTQGGAIAKMILGNPFNFPETFHTTAYLSSFFTFIPAIVVIMLITNEYTFKTHRQNIIDGWQKKTFIWGKFVSVALVTFIVSLFFMLVAIILGILATKTYTLAGIFGQSKYILLFSLQVFYQLSIAFLIGLLIRKAFIAYGIFIFYSFIVENIMVAFFKLKAVKFGQDFGRLLPMEISDRMIPVPAFLGKFDEAGYKAANAAVNTHVLYTIILTFLIWFLSFTLFKKRDL